MVHADLLLKASISSFDIRQCHNASIKNEEIN